MQTMGGVGRPPPPPRPPRRLATSNSTAHARDRYWLLHRGLDDGVLKHKRDSKRWESGNGR